MSKRNPFFLISLISLACITSAFAAQPVDLNHKPVSVLQSVMASSSLGASSQSSLKQISQDRDFNNTTHIRIQQMYANHPVWGGDIAVHVPEGGNSVLGHLSPSSTMNGIVYQGLNADLNSSAATFSSNQSEKAFSHALQLYQKQNGSQQYDSKIAQKELMVYVDKNNKAHWAYIIRFLTHKSDGKPALPTYILDASSFVMYEMWDDVQTLDKVQASGFGGNPKMGKLNYDGLSGHYPILDIQRNVTKKICFLQNENVQVKDDNYKKGPFDPVPVSQFRCDTLDAQHGNAFWNGEIDTANGAFSPANDALYIGQVVQGMYQKWYGIPALTSLNKPMKITMHVHTKDGFGRAMENAYFLNLNKEMYFGDGLSMFYPLTSLGVGAHEISHGFTAQHSKLVYQHQSGGLNESFSDMAAQAAEFYSTGHSSWLIGADIIKEEGALRYMDEPSKDGESISHMKGYHDGLDVHHTSGIFNKVFYLLGTSSSWNTKKAFDVMVKANMHYWTSTINFADAACGVIKATQDYKYDTEAVIQAMDAVGIITNHC